MKVSYSELTHYLDIPTSPEDLTAIFPQLGLEVESVQNWGVPPLEQTIVGEILTKEAHPNADRLTVCTVNVGQKEPLTIVCGAKNHAVGHRVFVALPGATLPGNFKIKKGKIRGITSEGMMCSASEIGLTKGSEGLLILEDKPEIGTPINAIYKNYDVVYDLSITANRNDALSYLGIARDLCAYFNLPLKITLTSLKLPEQPHFPIVVNLESPYAPYYSLQLIKNTQPIESPEFIKQSLEKSGLRSIHTVVDITNYILLHTGQPLHAFDCKKINGSITIRMANEGETLEALDNKTYHLNNNDLIIADNQGPIALAGIIGGKRTEVTAETEHILVESAYFEPHIIRQTTRRLNITTDSAYRFERGVDPEGVLQAAYWAQNLIEKITQGVYHQEIAICGKLPCHIQKITCNPQKIRDILGFGPENSVIQSMLERLQFNIIQQNDTWQVTVPSYRAEVNNIEGLAEEFLRIYGADKIPQMQPLLNAYYRPADKKNTFTNEISQQLTGAGFVECIHYSLLNETETRYFTDNTEILKIHNPLSLDQAYLRPSLLIGLLNAMRLNLNHKNDPHRLFEIGHVFIPHQTTVIEALSVSFIMRNASEKSTWRIPYPVDFYTIKQQIIHILTLLDIHLPDSSWNLKTHHSFWQNEHAATATLKINDHTYTMHAGLLNFKCIKNWDIEEALWAGEVIIPLDHFHNTDQPKRFEAFSLYPPVEKDIACILKKDTPAVDFINAIHQAIKMIPMSSINLEDIKIFDIYSGKGMENTQKSIAVRLRFRSLEKTLMDEDIHPIFQSLQTELKNLGYTLRTE